MKVTSSTGISEKLHQNDDYFLLFGKRTLPSFETSCK